MVLGRGRRATANRLAFALFVLNAGAALLAARAAIGPLPARARAGVDLLETLVNVASLVPLLLLPLVFPRRRITDRGALAIGVAVGVPLLALPTLRYLDVLPTGPWVAAAFWPAYHLVPTAGVLFLVDAYISSAGKLQRDQARFLLATYFLKLVIEAQGPTLAFTGDGEGLVPSNGAEAVLLATWWATDVVAFAGAMLVPIVLAVSRIRAARARIAPRPWGEDLFLLAFAALAWVPMPAGEEFLLVRPVLIAYAIIAYQIVEVDVRRLAVPLAVAALAAAAAMYVTLSRAGELLAVPAQVASGLALAGTLGALAAMVMPLLRIGGVATAHAAEPRRMTLYRGALETAAEVGEEETARQTRLRDLRRELGITDREHALLVGDLSHRSVVTPGVPSSVGRYRIVRPIGRGGSGEVFLARDERLGRDVALKRLASERRRDAAAVERFEKEMRLASAIHHPNIVAVHDLEIVADDAYLVMEYVAGGSLETRVRDAPFDEREAKGLARDLCAALEVLHARGIVHRDVKPANVLLAPTHDGRRSLAKLGDFTVARDIVSGDTVGVSGDAPVGTLAFMSPEQARGLPGTPASDLYSLAATVHFALTGRPPVDLDGLGDFDARLRIVRAPRPAPVPRVSLELNAWLARGLEPSPAARFGSAAEMLAALDTPRPEG